MEDLRTSASAIYQTVKPDHMNYELLGNSNPHLHWHIIPRYKTDPRWGQPIWEDYPRNEFNINRHVIPDDEIVSLVRAIQQHLDTVSY
jgi:diadenosine tetraphosphate (Ap4A) HIT family hydrolase